MVGFAPLLPSSVAVSNTGLSGPTSLSVVTTTESSAPPGVVHLTRMLVPFGKAVQLAYSGFGTFSWAATGAAVQAPRPAVCIRRRVGVHSRDVSSEV